jgi:hypothetical protein
MPPGNREAMVHYEDTIKNKVALETLQPFLAPDEVSQLRGLFGPRRVAVWGSRKSQANESKFGRMQPGDSLLIVEGKTIRSIGMIALKVVSPALSRALWKNLQDNATEGWDLIYFIANSVEVDVPFADFCKLFGYQENYQLRGFTVISEDRLTAFYTRYDDLYAILVRLRDGKPIEHRPPQTLSLGASEVGEPAPVQQEPPRSPHTEIQCKLAKLGTKAGQKVWVPVSDRQRIRDACDFDRFEERFSALDVETRYVENIDVVWKEQFRIDAAFEVENSTGIYSGLLRFADLTIVAPNTIYPLFIVAPGNREAETRRQVMRPTFKSLKLEERVLFLSYEEVNTIERFFNGSNGGVSIETIKAKARKLV